MQALLAGADALCLGHDIDDGHVARVRAAIVAAVREGRLDESRVAEAAGRVASSHVPVAAARAADAPPFAELGLAAARRALLVRGHRRRRHGRCCWSTSRARPRSPPGSRHTISRPILGELGADVEAIHDHGERGSTRRSRPFTRARIAGRWSSSATSTGIPGSSDAAAAILAADRRRGRRRCRLSGPEPQPTPVNGRITTFGSGRASLDGRRRAAARGTRDELRAPLRHDGPDCSLVDGVAAELIELGGEELAPVEQLARRLDGLAVDPHRPHRGSVPPRQRDVSLQPRAEPAGDELRVGARALDAQLLDRPDLRPELGEPAPPRAACARTRCPRRRRCRTAPASSA